MSSTVQDTLMGSASVEAEAIAAMATIDMSIDNTQGAEDGEVPDLIEVRKEEAHQREIRRETFRKRRKQWLSLAKNAYERNHQGAIPFSIAYGRYVHCRHNVRNP
jgi:hypothetical protein